jgi:hypothetical protein
LARASSREVKALRRRRAPRARVGRTDDRLVAVEGVEGPRARLLREQQGGAPTRVSEPGRGIEIQAIDDGQHVGRKAVPVEVSVRGPPTSTVRPQVERYAVEPIAKCNSHRRQHGCAEACGVGENEIRPVASEVVEADVNPIGGRRSPRRLEERMQDPIGITCVRRSGRCGHPGDATCLPGTRRSG